MLEHSSIPMSIIRVVLQTYVQRTNQQKHVHMGMMKDICYHYWMSIPNDTLQVRTFHRQQPYPYIVDRSRKVRETQACISMTHIHTYIYIYTPHNIDAHTDTHNCKSVHSTEGDTAYMRHAA